MEETNQCNVGIGMAMPVGLIENTCSKQDVMNLKNHKRLTDLAYRVKDFIDGNGGLNYHESCIFGQIMQNIINLK